MNQVPYTLESGKKTLAKKQFMQNVLGDSVGNAVYTFQRMVSHLVFGPRPSLLGHLGRDMMDIYIYICVCVCVCIYIYI